MGSEGGDSGTWHLGTAHAASDLALTLDRAAFARSIGVDPDPWQERLLHSEADRVLLNASRQSGKSTITALIAGHTTFYEPRSLVLLFSPTLRQSQELFKKCLYLYRAAGNPSRLKVRRRSR